MSSLVLELQRDALDDAVPVTSLLRKAHVVARKLDVHELEEWTSNELDGYPNRGAIPDYRVVHGEVKAFNPYNGIWMPMVLNDAEEAEQLSKRANNQCVAELEALLTSKDKNGMLHMPFSKAVANNLMSRSNIPVVPTLVVPRTEIVGILDAVRNIILNWSLRLERDGIVGTGMSFSDKEKRVAADTVYNVTHFHGSVSGSQIQQFSQNSSQAQSTSIDVAALTHFVDELRKALPSLGLKTEVRDEALAELDTLAAQAKSPKPKAAVVRESLKTIRNVLEEASGSLIATGLLSLLPKILG
jgi:hypothetical protein